MEDVLKRHNQRGGIVFLRMKYLFEMEKQKKYFFTTGIVNFDYAADKIISYLRFDWKWKERKLRNSLVVFVFMRKLNIGIYYRLLQDLFLRFKVNVVSRKSSKFYLEVAIAS